jgi:hypothetical protein
MAVRKLAVLPIAAVLALAAPVASANSATSPSTNRLANPAGIPCYPYPAFCGASGQPWFRIPSWWPYSPNAKPVH